MEALAVSLGIAPYLASRKILAVGVLVAWFAFRGMWETREVSGRAALFGILFGLLTLALHAALTWAKRVLRDALDPVRTLVQRGNEVAAAVVGMLLAVWLLKVLGTAVTAGPVALDAQVRPVLLGAVTPDALLVLTVGIVAFAFARARSSLVELVAAGGLEELPGLGRVLSWTESLGAVGGVLLALAFPLVGIAVMVVLGGAFLGVGLVLRGIVRGPRGACAACGHDLHLAATVCSRCGTERIARRLGPLGGVRDAAPSDATRHRLALLAAGRCPACAEHLPAAAPRCPACGRLPFRDGSEARALARRADTRFAALVPVFALLGLVPLLGLGAALLLYALSPASALGRYVGRRDRFATRLLRGLLLLALVFLQGVPLVGTLAGLAILSVTHLWTRQAFLRSPWPGEEETPALAAVAGAG